mmetsp:Transcript_24122/g.35542  ORF Transcript_24122/g.35542 Transcript_24122/m.35542 type:complete len:89 (-) Transcript_24122:456-722(-)
MHCDANSIQMGWFIQRAADSLYWRGVSNWISFGSNPELDQLLTGSCFSPLLCPMSGLHLGSCAEELIEKRQERHCFAGVRELTVRCTT